MSARKHFDTMTVAAFMEKDVQCGLRSTKADVLASQMIEGFGGMPIVDDDRRLVGIVTEFDLLDALDRGLLLSELTAQQIMTGFPISARKDMDAQRLIHLFKVNHLIRVPVVDQEDRLIGIVARRDILRSCLATLERTEEEAW
jgi:CBS-domain-containing membrane protein